MEALSKEQGAPIAAGTRKVSGRAFSAGRLSVWCEARNEVSVGSTDDVVIGGWPLSVAAAALAAVATLRAGRKCGSKCASSGAEQCGSFAPQVHLLRRRFVLGVPDASLPP